MIRIWIWAATFSLAMAMLFSGCRSMTPAVTFYTLSPMIETGTGTPSLDSHAMVVGIRPVDLPGTVDRTQMVLRSGPHQLTISSLNRWADYPNQLVQQAIGENLQALMPDMRVVSAPWPIGTRPDFTVAFKFHELIGTTDKEVLLSAVWTITSTDPVISETYRIHLTEPMEGRGYDELAAAHSRVLATLCHKVLDTLKKSSGR